MKTNAPASITRRIARLKRLAKEYFAMPDRAIIPQHTQLLRVFDIRGSKHKKAHPHKSKRVYVSRRSLKHFVESRKKDLLKKHSEAESIKLICFALERIQDVIINFERYELEPPCHFYVKDYTPEGNPPLRILVEPKAGWLEIRSIHFTKNRKIQQ